MTDYRLVENRKEYFTALYKMNLEHGVMPGLVYLYMPELAKRLEWDTEQKLWFAFINGMTQNPITSLMIFNKFPELLRDAAGYKKFDEFFNGAWASLSFDTDRRHQKKETMAAVLRYSNLVRDVGSQQKLLTGEFSDLWTKVYHYFHSFGRLSSFSYLEYVQIMASTDNYGYGADCDNLFFDDKEGSKSHRNGMFFMLGMDDMVWDKRHDNGFDGDYGDMKKLAGWLTGQANEYLRGCSINYKDLGYFTLESQCCQFKNGFFKRRYPGVYTDMALDRIKWYDERGMDYVTKIFKQIREDRLPEWLREECEGKVTPRAVKAAQFAETGVPFRAEYFL